jgi:RHS repeat-associated protein
VRFEYDGLGQRTRKVGLTDTTRYTWDGLYPVVEWTNQGKLKQSFVYANGLLLGIIDSTVGTNRKYFVLHDGLGSSIALTDSATSVKRSLIYSDFGERLVDATVSTVPAFNRLYAGYPWDGAPANFNWMLGRQSYDPTLGRFGQEDIAVHVPTVDPLGLNPYLYVRNNPIEYYDPCGVDAIFIGCGQYKGDMQDAYNQAKEAVNKNLPGCSCDPNLIKKLKDIFEGRMNWFCDLNNDLVKGGCSAHDRPGPNYWIGKLALFNKDSRYRDCGGGGCLAQHVLHEALHEALGGMEFEEKIKGLQKCACK